MGFPEKFPGHLPKLLIRDYVVQLCFTKIFSLLRLLAFCRNLVSVSQLMGSLNLNYHLCNKLQVLSPPTSTQPTTCQDHSPTPLSQACLMISLNATLLSNAFSPFFFFDNWEFPFLSLNLRITLKHKQANFSYYILPNISRCS